METKKEQKAIRVRELKHLLLDTISGATNKVFISEKKLDFPHVKAETDMVTEEIVIHPNNNTLAEAVHAFIHEHLHLYMPEEGENSVYAMAKAIYEDMTVQERQRMFRLMARRAKWED